MACSKISSHGQITIPRKIREKYGIEKGDLISYNIESFIKNKNGKVIPFEETEMDEKQMKINDSYK